jgi:hypothetical protein
MAAVAIDVKSQGINEVVAGGRTKEWKTRREPSRRKLNIVTWMKRSLNGLQGIQTKFHWFSTSQ